MTTRPIPTVFKDVPKVALPKAQEAPVAPVVALSAVEAELKDARRWEAAVAVAAGFAAKGYPGTAHDIANRAFEWADALLARRERV